MGNVYIKFTDDNSDSLTHYGVKGMKWGKRKAKNHLAKDALDEISRAEHDQATMYDAYARQAAKKVQELGRKANGGRIIVNDKKNMTLTYNPRKAWQKYAKHNSPTTAKQERLAKEKGKKKLESIKKDALLYKNGRASKIKVSTHQQTSVRGTPKKTIKKNNGETVYYKNVKGLSNIIKTINKEKNKKKSRRIISTTR